MEQRLHLMRELMDPGNAELLQAAAQARAEGRELAAGERLRRTHPGELVAAAFGQAELRERAVTKFGGRAAQLWLTRDGLEQASGQALAAHRAGRLARAGDTVADLCCGIGGDLMALAATGAELVAVDLDAVHLLCAAANADARVATRLEDVRDTSLAGITAVLVDPARRRDGRRVTAGEPPLAWCAEIPVERMVVKAAPGLDPAGVPDGWQVEFVAEGRDLKESVLWSPGLRDGGGARLATVIAERGTHSLGDDGAGPAALGEPGGWLLDCNPAVGRAGAVDTLARMTGARKVDERIAFLSADEEIATPFGRSLRVERSLPFDLAVIGRLLRTLDVGAADLRRRGLAGDVDSMRKRLQLKGSRRVTLVLTRVRDKPWALICVEPTDPPL